MTTQIKLLRVLEERTITRVGDNKTDPGQRARPVGDQSRSGSSRRTRGEFRSDLYYRLKVITVDLPPLRERREDIVPLTDHFRKHFAKGASEGRSRADLGGQRPGACFGYDWPGNIRATAERRRDHGRAGHRRRPGRR